MQKALPILTDDKLVKAIFSQPQDAQQYKKIVARPVCVKAEKCIQLEQYTDNKVFHLNIAFSDWVTKATQLLSQ